MHTEEAITNKIKELAANYLDQVSVFVNETSPKIAEQSGREVDLRASIVASCLANLIIGAYLKNLLIGQSYLDYIVELAHSQAVNAIVEMRESEAKQEPDAMNDQPIQGGMQ